MSLGHATIHNKLTHCTRLKKAPHEKNVIVIMTLSLWKCFYFSVPCNCQPKRNAYPAHPRTAHNIRDEGQGDNVSFCMDNSDRKQMEYGLV